MRIVSLLPSATEIICALGLRDQLVGVSHECDFPADVQGLPKVTASAINKNQSSLQIDQQVREQLQTSTALYMLDIELLETLKPDLIITQALCDVCAVSAEDVESAICRLPTNPAIINLEPVSLTDVVTTIRKVGAATQHQQQAEALITDMMTRKSRVETACKTGGARPRVACLEWLDPPFNAGHWTPELVTFAGGTSVTGQSHQPSTTMIWQDVIAAQPDILFIACCGYSIERTLADLPVLTAEPALRELPFWKNNRIYVTDGNHYFNRPGPRLIDSLEILAHALHGEKVRLPDHLSPAIHIDTQTLIDEYPAHPAHN